MTNLMHKFKTETHHKIYVDDFDEIIRTQLAPLTENPDRYKDFESRAEFEWYDADYSTSVSISETTSNFYLKYDKKDIMYGKSHISYHYIMVFLLEHGLIEEGKYTVSD